MLDLHQIWDKTFHVINSGAYHQNHKILKTSVKVNRQLYSTDILHFVV